MGHRRRRSCSSRRPSTAGHGRPRRLAHPGTQVVYTVTVDVGSMNDERGLALVHVLCPRPWADGAPRFSKPTKGVAVQFACDGCGIDHVTVLDYIASSMQPGLPRLPASEPMPSIVLRFDELILLKVGVAFVWSLTDEVTPSIVTPRVTGHGWFPVRHGGGVAGAIIGRRTAPFREVRPSAEWLTVLPRILVVNAVAQW